MTWTWKTNDRDEIYVDRGDDTGFLRPTLSLDPVGVIARIERVAQWAELAKKIGLPNGSPLHWTLGVIYAESGGDPTAVSTLYDDEGKPYPGARGLMQIMPATAQGLGYDPDTMFHPPSNIGAGTTLLGDFRDKNFDFPASLSMYNAGPAVPMGPKKSLKSPWGYVENDNYITTAVAAANYFRREWAQTSPKQASPFPVLMVAGLLYKILA